MMASVPSYPEIRAADTDAEVLAQLADALITVTVDSEDDDGGHGDNGIEGTSNGGGRYSSAEVAVLSSGFSADEREAFLSGQPVTAGMGAIFVHEAQRLLAVAASVAALSAEALQAQVLTTRLWRHQFVGCHTS